MIRETHTSELPIIIYEDGSWEEIQVVPQQEVLDDLMEVLEEYRRETLDIETLLQIERAYKVVEEWRRE